MRMMLVELLRQPWFAISPSPFSMAFYAVMAAIGSQLLIHRVNYRRVPMLLGFLDSLFLLGILIFIQDTFWLICNTVKWIIPLYSGVANFWNYYVRFPQNILGALLLLLLTWHLWKSKTVRFKKGTWICLVLIYSITLINFILAPNQAFSDWVFAANHDYADWIVIQGFILNVIIKVILGLAFLSMFKIEDNSIRLFKEEQLKEERRV